MKSLTPALIGIAVVTVAIVAIVAVLVLAGSKDTERFLASRPALDDASWRGPKTMLLLREGVHQFFTDGSFYPDKLSQLGERVMFATTAKDTHCYYMNDPPADLRCMHVPLAQLASVDRIGRRQVSCESSLTLASAPRQEDDRARILNCEYALRKRCIKLCDATVAMNQGPSGGMVLKLPPGTLATNVFVLSRPVFVCGMSTVLYAVSYDAAAYRGMPHTIVSYDSSRTDAMTVILRPVSGSLNGKTWTFVDGTQTLFDAARAAAFNASGNARGLSQHQQASEVTARLLSLDLFCFAPVQSLAATVPLTEAFSACFESLRAPLLLDSRYLRVEAVQTGPDNELRTLRVRRGSSVAEMVVPQSAKIIVTYAVNCITMTAFDKARGLIKHARFVGFPELSVPDPTDLRAMLSTLKRPLVEPLAIPDLTDVAVRLGMPLGSDCPIH